MHPGVQPEDILLQELQATLGTPVMLHEIREVQNDERASEELCKRTGRYRQLDALRTLPSMQGTSL